MSKFDIIKKEIQQINLSLPKKRKKVKKLLKEENPSVKLRSGDKHEFKSEELKKIKEKIGNIRIPIYIEISNSHKGKVRIKGKKEVKLIQKILGTYDELQLEEKTELYVYKSDIRKVRRKLPTTTFY
ncbi:MAG: DUF61 family protein, partial [Thermoplasmatota archaeon]